MGKISLKYCGGCNPNFDRRKAAEAILAGIEEERGDLTFPLCLVVCGCERACATRPEGTECFVVDREVKDAGAVLERMRKRISERTTRE